MTTIEKNKALCEEMHYLMPHNAWTGKVVDTYDYSYIEGEYNLPPGWFKLFLQMCEDIRQPLIDANFIDKFYFTEIKEKYDTMRCYNNGAPEAVHRIIGKYEYMSEYICQKCGKPAKYQTDGWITSYCEDCIKSYLKPEYIDECNKLEFDPIIVYTKYSKDGKEKIKVDCSDEWRRLYE